MRGITVRGGAVRPSDTPVRAGRLAAAVAVLLAAASLTAGAAPAADAPVTATMTMTGDPATGSLSFRQDLLDLRAGDTVRFHNASGATEHTATEVHGLWEVAVGAGADATRTMEAGTHLIVCRLHPALMRATIRVSPDTRIERRVVRVRHRRVVRRTAVVVWAPGPPAAGESFDVERRHGEGPWEDWRSATTDPSGRFAIAPGDGWQVRARLRSATAEGAWSPAAPIVP